jgi:hypothetical protein
MIVQICKFFLFFTKKYFIFYFSYLIIIQIKSKLIFTLPYYFYFVFLREGKKLRFCMLKGPKMPNFKVIVSSMRSQRQKIVQNNKKNIKLK